MTTNVGPLFSAVRAGCLVTIDSLLSQEDNIDINEKNSEGQTLLQAAVLHGHVDIIKFLIDAGADVKLEDDDHESAMKFAFKCQNHKTKITIMKMLVMAGADVNTSYDSYKRSGRTALLEAATTGDVELVQLLLDRGANPVAEDAHEDVWGYTEHWTAVHYAAANIYSEDPAIFEILLSAYYAKIDSMSEGLFNSEFCSETPLHVLAKFSPKIPSLSLCKIIKVFKNYGANLDNPTLLQLAADNSNSEGLKALVLCGANVNSIPSILHTVCGKNDLSHVKFLIKNKADINLINFCGRTPLKIVIDTACYNHRDEKYFIKSMEILEYLLHCNPDVNLVNPNTGENILTSIEFYEFPSYLWKRLLRHLAKIQATKSSICESLLNTIHNHQDYKNYFERCNQELHVAKICNIHPDSWITFFNLLVDDKKKLFQYAGNINLVNNFKVIFNFSEICPIYNFEIYKRLSKATEKRKIWFQAAMKLCSFFPVTVDPEHGVILKLISFLNSKDLKKLS